MPHCVVLYTPNIENKTDMSALCRKLADAMLDILDESGNQVFPNGGTRVYALPAAHYAVSDGGTTGRVKAAEKGWSPDAAGDYAFVYVNIRMATGRSDATKKRAGDALSTLVKAHFDPLLQSGPLGITVQVDESPGQVYDAKISSLHPLFS
jgi:5-carboxymethyl-2-hydroxymuconate isomerase